jgi:hypothetical protein
MLLILHWNLVNDNVTNIPRQSKWSRANSTRERDVARASSDDETPSARPGGCCSIRFIARAATNIPKDRIEYVCRSYTTGTKYLPVHNYKTK